MQKNVTIKDIAQEMQLSVNTISRALRDMSDISEETKNKIRAKALEMGYKKNYLASTLRTNRSQTIGVIMPDILNPVYSGMYKGIESICKKSGYTILLANSNENIADERREIETMISHQVDGIILCPTMKNSDNLRILKNESIPYVLLARSFYDKTVNSVVNNDFTGGYLACDYLISKGYNSFLYLTGPLYISSARERRDGFVKCMQSKGIPEESLTVCETEPTWKGAYKSMTALLKNGFQKKSIFAFSDFMAMGVLKALKEKDISVPEDIAVIGYDNIDLCDLTTPSLTTVDICKFRLGVQGIKLLLEVLNNKREASYCSQITLEPKIIARGSA